MPTLREEMRARSRLSRIRQGQEVPEYFDIPSMEGIRVALVPLTEAEETRSTVAAVGLDVGENLAGLRLRDRTRMQWNLWQALRDPADLGRPLYENVEAMTRELEVYDIEYLSLQLTTLMEYASPALDGFSTELLEDLKKVLLETDWSELTGRRWAAVKVCLSVLFNELLQGRSLSSFSTVGSTTMSENDESTIAAVPS
jgi:hypothetical protein